MTFSEKMDTLLLGQSEGQPVTLVASDFLAIYEGVCGFTWNAVEKLCNKLSVEFVEEISFSDTGRVRLLWDGEGAHLGSTVHLGGTDVFIPVEMLDFREAELERASSSLEADYGPLVVAGVLARSAWVQTPYFDETGAVAGVVSEELTESTTAMVGMVSCLMTRTVVPVEVSIHLEKMEVRDDSYMQPAYEETKMVSCRVAGSSVTASSFDPEAVSP